MSAHDPLRDQRRLLALLSGVVVVSVPLLLWLRSDRGLTRSPSTPAPRAPAPGTEEEPPLAAASAPIATGTHDSSATGERNALESERGDGPSGTEVLEDAVVGRVTCRGTPLAGVELRLFEEALDREEAREPLASGVSGPDGGFRLPVRLAHARHVLHAQHPQCRPEERTLHPGHFEELELAPAARMSGRVLSTRGTALEGVEVALRARNFDAQGMHESESVRSDAEGRWSLGWAEPGIQELLVTRPGCLPERREFQVGTEGGSGYEIVLDEDRRLALEVFELESGASLPDTELLSDGVLVRTDAGGRLFLARSPSATADEVVRVSLGLAEGCATQGRVPSEALLGALRVPVTNGASVRGRVLDARGQPVEGARVRLSGGGRAIPTPMLPEGFWLSAARGTVRSDAEGRFLLTGQPPREGLVVLRAQHPLYPQGRSEPFELQHLGEALELEIVLREGATLEGRVRLDGAPAALRVHWSVGGSSGWTRADDRGAYRITGLDPGEVELRVRADDEDEDVPRLEDRSVWAEEGVTLTVDFELASHRARLRGRVLDASGEAVAGAEVRATPSDPESLIDEEPRTESARDGSFELAVPDVPGLRFDLTAESGPRRARAEYVRAGDADVELRLPNLARAYLRVLDALSRAPVQGFQLYWRPSEAGRYERLVQGGRRLSGGPDGSFLAELPAGSLDLVVSARAQGYAPCPRPETRLSERDTPTLEFLLEHGTELEIHVEGAPGAQRIPREWWRGQVAIASDEQWAERARGGSYFQQEVRQFQALRVGPDGVAHLTALSSGHYRFIQIPGGQAVKPRDFQLPPVARHVLHVTVSVKPRDPPEKPGGGRD